eukprot:3704364-Amphidinium_carterae.1
MFHILRVIVFVPIVPAVRCLWRSAERATSPMAPLPLLQRSQLVIALTTCEMRRMHACVLVQFKCWYHGPEHDSFYSGRKEHYAQNEGVTHK